MAREINVVLRVCLDFVCLLAVGLPILILFLVGKPYQRGYFCDDESIRHPFKDSTITNNALYCVGIFFPVTVMVICEIIRFRTSECKILKPSLKFLKWDVHLLVWQIYRKLGYFAFGACLSQFTTDIAKYTIGRLRPHFILLCNPVFKCEESFDHKYAYIENVVCQNPDSHLMREARLSFMSGHSSFSAYTMIFLALYLQSRMTYTRVALLRPFLQAACLYIAWYTALSRISDYKHHWSDVLAGSLQGTIVALVVVFCFSDLFRKKPIIINNTSETTLEKQIGYNSVEPNTPFMDA